MVCSLNSEAHSPESEKVLMFIRDGSGDLDYTLKAEVGVMKQILEQSGFTVVVTTVSGEPLLTDSVNITPDLSLSDVNIHDYSGIILPCMHAGASSDKVNAQAVKVVKDAIMAEVPIAVQHASISILARAGLLQGRKYTFHTEVDVADFPDFKGGVYSGQGVVRDGWMITSGVCPYLAEHWGLEDCTQELTLALVNAIREKTR
jgi:putative intracellular protease/amidase